MRCRTDRPPFLPAAAAAAVVHLPLPVVPYSWARRRLGRRRTRKRRWLVARLREVEERGLGQSRVGHGRVETLRVA